MEKAWQQAPPDKNGHVTASKIASILVENSGLPRQDLRRIWNLAKSKNSPLGFMSYQEYCAAFTMAMELKSQRDEQLQRESNPFFNFDGFVDENVVTPPENKNVPEISSNPENNSGPEKAIDDLLEVEPMEDDELDEMHEIVEGVELLSDGELEELGKAEVNIMNIDDEVSTDSDYDPATLVHEDAVHGHLVSDLGQFSLGGKQLVDEPEYDPETLTDCAAPVQLGRKLVDEGEYDPETMTDCAAPTIGHKKGLVDEDEYDPETMTDCADISRTNIVDEGEYDPETLPQVADIDKSEKESFSLKPVDSKKVGQKKKLTALGEYDPETVPQEIAPTIKQSTFDKIKTYPGKRGPPDLKLSHTGSTKSQAPLSPDIVQYLGNSNTSSPSPPLPPRNPMHRNSPKLQPKLQLKGSFATSSSTTDIPFLCDAIASNNMTFLMKTNASAALVLGDYWIKQEGGRTIFEVPGKGKFKKEKKMCLQFVPQMSGVYFTPGVKGRPEGDQKVAVIQKKKHFCEIYAFKPFYDDQAPVSKSDTRYTWARAYPENEDSFIIATIEPGSKKNSFQEKYRIKRHPETGHWQGILTTDENEEVCMGTISIIDYSIVTGMEIEVYMVKTEPGYDAGFLIVAALLVDEI
eukprot:m.118916 g.118916  ORF g.118916 m.118916 type:complete len:633 (+) comp14296_c0_seq1:275-2173(+)